MKVLSLSAAFTTIDVEKTRDFYVRHFAAKVTFDCGWYVNLEFGSPSATLQFMSPQKPEHQPGTSEGLIYNIAVAEVDREYERLTGEGLEAVVPLENHPWGDRGFAVRDPNGISLYIYSERKPDEEFMQYFR
ncbi:MAG: glyoxalase [Chlorobiaceae bacterium]|nr:glyoxalase [Chlorobiaceae bacterium]NTW11018.1 glyoxalase [Chlorobiaceae bacterium]